jgi:hypothetical protein
MASIWWLSSDVTIASSLEKIWKPQPSMWGLGPHQCGLRLSSASWSFWYLTSIKGPPETTGCPFCGVFG